MQTFDELLLSSEHSSFPKQVYGWCKVRVGQPQRRWIFPSESLQFVLTRTYMRSAMETRHSNDYCETQAMFGDDIRTRHIAFLRMIIGTVVLQKKRGRSAVRLFLLLVHT